MTAHEIVWEPFVPIGPKLAHHAACVVRNCLYLHGGVSVYASKEPSNKLYKLNLDEDHCIWGEVHCDGSPALSHHTCVALGDRYILIIGGWTGKQRSGKVCSFDVETNTWTVPSQSGFPTDAGLSSHTATPLSNGQIMILGREGSLRIQRRTGTAFLLTGSVEKGFKFSDFSHSITSRSGHTVNVVGSKMYVIGGRSDNLLEFQEGFKSGTKCSASSLTDLFKVPNGVVPVSKLPCGRKHHVSMSGTDCLLIHGGETFDGKSREPVGDMFLVTLVPQIRFFKLKNDTVKRAGHICFTDGINVYIHGGVTGKSTICGDIHKLVISK